MIAFEAIAPGTKAVLEALGATDKEIPKILSAALNKTAPSLRAAAVRMITRDYVVKAGEVRNVLKIRYATRASLVARIEGQNRFRIPLARFRVGGRRVPSTYWQGAKGKKRPMPAKGVSVHVKRREPVKTIRGGFVAKMPSGHIGLFVRTGRKHFVGRASGKRGGRSEKEVIVQRMGPNPLDLLRQEHYTRELDFEAAQLMDKNVKSAASFILSKLR